jgi:hypothetical protein
MRKFREFRATGVIPYPYCAVVTLEIYRNRYMQWLLEEKLRTAHGKLAAIRIKRDRTYTKVSVSFHSNSIEVIYGRPFESPFSWLFKCAGGACALSSSRWMFGLTAFRATGRFGRKWVI